MKFYVSETGGFDGDGWFASRADVNQADIIAAEQWVRKQCEQGKL